MAHDVFISHAYKDKGIAEAICEKLEAARVRCWIAERDITAGDNWTEATRNAIESSRVMVLVLSENANASAHIEREIAHAFYTGRQIVPLRLSSALPKRDFLFYLGDVRWLDGFSMPAEQQVEALAESISGMLHAPIASGDIMSARDSTGTPEPFNFAESSIAVGPTPDSQNLETSKCVAIAAALIALVCLLWFAPWQPKHEMALTESDRSMISSDADPSQDSRPSASGDTPVSKSADASLAFRWPAPPNIASTPLGLQESAGPDPTPSFPQSAIPRSSPQPDVNQEPESPGLSKGVSPKTVQEEPARTADRHDMHRKKARTKRHNRRTGAPEESPIERIQSRLNAVWHHIVD
jgi:hypothetical protein